MDARPIVHGGDIRRTRGRLRATFVVGGVLTASVAIGFGLRAGGLGGVGEANALLIFVLGVAVVAFFCGRSGSVVTAVLAVLAFNFFFTYPLHTLAVADIEYVVTFAVLLVTGVGVSDLVARQREHAERAREQAEANRLLYGVGRALGSTSGWHATADAACAEIRRWLRADAEVLLPDDDARAATPGPSRYYVPLLGAQGARLGVLAVHSTSGPLGTRERQKLDALADPIALALEREKLAEAARRGAVEAESERLRANLLATVSHDLRTPLAAICGASGTLLAQGDRLDRVQREELLWAVQSEAERLTRMVENLLQLGRLDDGRLHLSKEWYPLDEVVGAALALVAHSDDTARVQVDLPAAPVLVPMNADLLVNVFQNLFDNALRYAPEGAIMVSAQTDHDEIEVCVRDSGPGLPEGDSERLFERFVRGDGSARRGSGLGLAICRAILHAHGGRIRAERPAAGGACFRFWLPLEGGLEIDDEFEGCSRGEAELCQ